MSFFSRRSRRMILLVAVAGMIGFLMLFRQPLYPAPWFDEGLNVSTAAMLARTGLYALPDSSGPRVLDPAIQTGPTVLLPVALAFRLFGIGIMQARLTMLVFAALTLVTYMLVAKRLIGQAATLAVLFLLVGTLEPYASFVYMSRQVLGEVPALGFYLLGLLIWWRVLERRTNRGIGLVLAGLAWGLAMVTKSQVMLLLPISLGLLALVDRAYYRQASWPMFIVPGMLAVTCVLVWYLAQIAILGPEQFQRNTQVLREGFTLHVAGLNPVHWRNAVGVIWRTGWWLWAMPGMLWGLWQARERSRRGFSHAAALALPLVWLFWFVGLSVGWARYAFCLIALSPIWTAGLLSELWHGRLCISQPATRRWLAVGLIILYVAINGRPLASNLVTPTDSGYLAMQDYLAAQVPADAVIETWEWEISLAARQPIHHPPTQVTNAYTMLIYSGRPLPSNVYDVLQVQPQYILEGPFSSWTGIYQQVLPKADQVASFGQYALYRLGR